MRPSVDSRRSTWWFVRHGQSVANAEGWLAGHMDAALTQQGRDEARTLRRALEGIRPSSVVSSDLVRARETAALAWPQAAVAHPALRERSVGAQEGVSIAELRRSGTMNALLTWTGRPPGGESQRDLAIRVLGWLAANDTGSDTLLFVHGGLIRVVIGLVDGTPVDQIGRWAVKNVEVVERQLPIGRWAELLAEIS